MLNSQLKIEIYKPRHYLQSQIQNYFRIPKQSFYLWVFKFPTTLNQWLQTPQVSLSNAYSNRSAWLRTARHTSNYSQISSVHFKGNITPNVLRVVSEKKNPKNSARMTRKTKLHVLLTSPVILLCGRRTGDCEGHAIRNFSTDSQHIGAPCTENSEEASSLCVLLIPIHKQTGR